MAESPRSNGALWLWRWLSVPVLSLAAACLASASAPPDEAEPNARIRLQWTGAQPQNFAGVLETSQGTFVSPVSLSTEANQAGMLWADRQNVWLMRRGPQRTDGFEVTLRAQRSARICFTLQTGDQGGWRRRFEWTLGDLGPQPLVFAFGGRAGRLIVSRAPGDELRVVINRPHLIFRPGETFKALLLPDLSAGRAERSTAKLEWEIRVARTREVVSKGSMSPPPPRSDQSSVPAQIPIELALPDVEGSLDLRFRLIANASDRLESVVQVLVLADQFAGHSHPVHADVGADASRLEQVVLASAAAPSIGQLAGPHLRTPDFNSVFGPRQDPQSFSRRDTATWDDFYAGARQAADYLRTHGDTCLMLPVLADGGTLYPSAFVERSVRFDRGLLSGRDPMQKDIVELLYRVFDRNGLALIPELRFAGPLTGLERQLAAGESAAQGIELVGPDGRSPRDLDGSMSGVQPSYNPLDPRVQNAVLDVVREFAQRYQHHPSFRGIAVEIDRTGYLQFPGIEWGCDDATLVRFQRDTGIRINDSTHLAAELLHGEARSKWIAWRCAELAGFYRRLASAVTSCAPQGRLILACKQSPAASEIQLCNGTLEALPLDDTLAQQGLDLSLFEGTPHLDVLRLSSARPLLLEFDRTPPSKSLGESLGESSGESFGEALVPVETTRR